ncbi:MAG TPA: F0F1 ATP synthase subunit A [Balneolaceae bacterium]|nr:F0F1 ATP synthase subunit A [Balneolaceae bacterium]
MEIDIDKIKYLQWGFFKLNATLLFSLIVIILLVVGAWLGTRSLTDDVKIKRSQALLESIVTIILQQIEEATQQKPEKYLPFIGTLFLYIVTSNILEIMPGFRAPTASLSTTAALACCVFVAVPVFGIATMGFKEYMRHYIQPTPLMLPFNIIGEFSRTVALAVRLFGNILSGSLIVAVLVSLTPLFFPVIMRAFGLLIGIIQAYVFAILALVYIASANQAYKTEQTEKKNT